MRLMTVLRIRGNLVARIDGDAVEFDELLGDTMRVVDRVELDAPIAWIELAPDGSGALLRDPGARRAWWWRRGRGTEPLVTSSGPRDPFGCGYVTVEGVSIVLIAHGGLLRGLDASGDVRFEAALGPPRPFRPSVFVELPGGRLALLGEQPGDPFDMVATVKVERLVSDPRAVETALTTLAPVWDRTAELAVGPGPGMTALVYRNPNGEEEADDDEDEGDYVGGDVVAFTGFYLRDLDSGALVQRLPFDRPIRGRTMIRADERAILAFAAEHLLEVDRVTGAVREIAGTAVTFDRDTGRIARLGDNGRIEVLERAD